MRMLWNLLWQHPLEVVIIVISIAMGMVWIEHTIHRIWEGRNSRMTGEVIIDQADLLVKQAGERLRSAINMSRSVGRGHNGNERFSS